MRPAAAELLLVLGLLLAPLLHVARGDEDPFPRMLAGEKKARPSGTYAYDDVPLDRDPRVEQPCLSARFCECTAQGGWNRTFWLNTASAMFQGQLYVAILQRTTMYRPKITYHQNKVTRRNQVMEANTLIFCKADLLSRKVRAYECKSVNPQAEYRERHPFPTHQHFNLVGLIDPRLASAGDEDGLYLQVGCRPKVLADLHEITKFRETPCLIKVKEGSRAAGSRPADSGGSTATSHLRRMLSAGGGAEADGGVAGSSTEEQQPLHGGRQQQPQQSQWLPLGQRFWSMFSRRRLMEGEGAASGETQAASSAAATADTKQQDQAAAAATAKAADSKAQEQQAGTAATDSKLQVKQQEQQAAGQQQQQQRQAQERAEVGGDKAPQDMVAEGAAELLTHGMGDVTKDWTPMHLNPIAYTSGEQFPCEKNWVPFQYRGRLLWNRHLSPQEIITVHANGTATTLFRNDNADVFKPLDAVCGKGPRGNTPAIRVSKEESGLPHDYYLGILHWTPQRGAVSMDTMERQCHEYLNFFYLMEAEPPFNIVEVARPPIPLMAATHPIYEAWPLRFGMGYISFPTGMVVTQGKVIITYGVGDRNVRVWRAALKDVLLTFSDDVVGQMPDRAPAATSG